MIPTVLHVMGCTNAGKTTFLDALKTAAPDRVHLVEVGKMMRAKYLDPASPHYQPDFFKGQAAPEHTQAEAWQMYLDGLREGFDNGASLIVVDGQPRDVPQVDGMVGTPHAVFGQPGEAYFGINEETEEPIKFDCSLAFLLIHADHEVRDVRLRDRFGIPENQGDAIDVDPKEWEGYQLGVARMVDDYRSAYVVLQRLALYGYTPQILDTSVMPIGDRGLEMMRGAAAVALNQFAGDDE